MGTYWDDFIKEYKDYLHTRNMSKILEAFWHYCNAKNPHGKSNANDIMGKQ